HGIAQGRPGRGVHHRDTYLADDDRHPVRRATRRPTRYGRLNRSSVHADALPVPTAPTCRARLGSEHGFGLLGVVLSLLVVGVLGAAATAALGTGGGAGAGHPSLGVDVARAFDVEAQFNLSNAIQNVL